MLTPWEALGYWSIFTTGLGGFLGLIVNECSWNWPRFWVAFGIGAAVVTVSFLGSVPPYIDWGH